MMGISTVASSVTPVKILPRATAEQETINESRKPRTTSASSPPALTMQDIATAQMESVNYTIAKMQNARWFLQNIESEREGMIRVFGPEKGEDVIQSWKKEAEETLTTSDRDIAGYTAVLKQIFEITGEITTRTSSGDYEFGDFTLTAKDNSFALQVDKKNGVFVKESTEGWKRDTGTFAALTLLGAPKDQSFRVLDVAV